MDATRATTQRCRAAGSQTAVVASPQELRTMPTRPPPNAMPVTKPRRWSVLSFASIRLRGRRTHGWQDSAYRFGHTGYTLTVRLPAALLTTAFRSRIGPPCLSPKMAASLMKHRRAGLDLAGRADPGSSSRGRRTQRYGYRDQPGSRSRRSLSASPDSKPGGGSR